MSIDLVAAALWLPLEPARKLVLLALCERANMATGLCWPGREEIAARASLSGRRVTHHLQVLEADGYLRSRPGRSWMHETTRRWLNVRRILDEGEERRREFMTRRDAAEPAWINSDQAAFELGDETSLNFANSAGPGDLGDDEGNDQGTLSAELGDAGVPSTEPSENRHLLNRHSAKEIF